MTEEQLEKRVNFNLEKVMEEELVNIENALRQARYHTGNLNGLLIVHRGKDTTGLKQALDYWKDKEAYLSNERAKLYKIVYSCEVKPI